MPGPFDLLAGPVVEIGKILLDRVFPDKVAQAKERAEAEFKLLQLSQEAEFKTKSQEMAAILAEAQSADPWTSRARPSFMYVMYLMILMAIPMGVLAAFRPEMATAIATGMTNYLKAIPDGLYALFGFGYGGYAWSRSYEKGKGVTR